jgi:hypothetical protein
MCGRGGFKMKPVLIPCKYCRNFCGAPVVRELPDEVAANAFLVMDEIEKCPMYEFGLHDGLGLLTAVCDDGFGTVYSDPLRDGFYSATPRWLLTAHNPVPSKQIAGSPGSSRTRSVLSATTRPGK